MGFESINHFPTRGQITSRIGANNAMPIIKKKFTYFKKRKKTV